MPQRSPAPAAGAAERAPVAGFCSLSKFVANNGRGMDASFASAASEKRALYRAAPSPARGVPPRSAVAGGRVANNLFRVYHTACFCATGRFASHDLICLTLLRRKFTLAQGLAAEAASPAPASPWTGRAVDTSPPRPVLVTEAGPSGEACMQVYPRRPAVQGSRAPVTVTSVSRSPARVVRHAAPGPAPLPPSPAPAARAHSSLDIRLDDDELEAWPAQAPDPPQQHAPAEASEGVHVCADGRALSAAAVFRSPAPSPNRQLFFDEPPEPYARARRGGVDWRQAPNSRLPCPVEHLARVHRCGAIAQSARHAGRAQQPRPLRGSGQGAAVGAQGRLHAAGIAAASTCRCAPPRPRSPRCQASRCGVESASRGRHNSGGDAGAGASCQTSPQAKRAGRSAARRRAQSRLARLCVEPGCKHGGATGAGHPHPRG